MIKGEWKSLFKDKFMMVVVAAIMIIPTIYTTIFLGSMWDPYGKIDKLPVAIVNNDKSAVYKDKTIEVGKELVDNLKENNSLDFNFVDKNVAKSGLENGTYYMVITIPENFSENATTLMDDTPKQMELEYEINPGTNYIASKMSQTAVTKIRDSIQEKVTKQYAETIFDKINDLGDGLTEAADGTNTALNGINKLKDGNDKITSGAQELASKSLVFKEGADTLQSGLIQYTDGVKAAKDGSDKLKDVHKYTNGVQRAKNGSVPILLGAEKFNTKIPALSGAMSQISSKSGDLKDGVNGILKANNQFINILGSISQGIGNIVNEDSETYQQINTLKAANSQFNNGIKSLNEQLQNSDSSQIANAFISIGSNAEAAGNVYRNTTSEIMNSNAFKKLNDNEKAEILKILKDNGANLNNNLTTIGDNTKNVADKVQSNMNEIKKGVSTIADKSNMVLSSNTEAINQLTNGLSNIKSIFDRQGEENSKDMGLIQAMNKINSGVNSLSEGINGYTSAVDKVNGLTLDMPSKVNELYLGISQLDSGLTELTGKNPEIDKGIDGLNDGLNKLNSKSGDLLSGISRLSDGSEKISDGSSKLADGSEALGNGLNELYDGTVKLNEGLTKGADEVNGINTSDDTYEMIASPVETDESFMTNIDNNGNAMAPYMMCVGLWVACIAFCIMYPLTSYKGKMENAFKWWLSKASILGFVTVLQAIIMVFMLKGINGLNPARLLQTILVACLASLTFMAIMYFFNILMGKVGSFLMLIFMVLQLGGCAGTYPVELAAPIYSVIKPLMPFTYCVHAFRASICDGVSITKDILIILSILLIFTLMTIAVFYFKARKVMNDEGEIEDSLVNA